MTEYAMPSDKSLRILLEALTTISYLKGDDGRASAIAEYALDQYEQALRLAGSAEGGADLPYLPGLHPEHRICARRRRVDRRQVDCASPAGMADRRQGVDRRVNPDRRGEA